MAKKTAPPKAPNGFTVLANASGGSCSHDGVHFETDANGYVIVPNSAVAALTESHGFSHVGADGEIEAPAPADTTALDAKDAEIAALKAELAEARKPAAEAETAAEIEAALTAEAAAGKEPA